MKIEKIKKVIKEKRIFATLKKRIKDKRKFYHVNNKLVRNLQCECEEYIRLKNKYSYIINKGIKKEKSEKSDKIWICWFQGVDNAPKLVQKCIESIKESVKEKEVIIIDLKNYKKYITLPQYIIEKFERKNIPYAQFSDILRVSLLVKYGGIWLDSTVFCTDKLPDYIVDSELFVFKNIELDKADKNPIVASSWLISAYSNNNILRLTQNLLFEYWKREKILTNYFIFHLFFSMATEKFKDEWEKVPTFSNANPHILQFECLEKYDSKRFEQIKKISSVHKLDKNLEKNKIKDTYIEYILNQHKN